METIKKATPNQRLINFMIQNGLDEKQIALKIGKDPSTIYRITAGKTVPHKKTMISIANSFGLAPDYFFIEQPDMAVANTLWRDEAFSIMKSELDYLKAKYDQLLIVALKRGLIAFGTGVKDRKRQRLVA